VSRSSRPTGDLKLTWPSKPATVRAEPASLCLDRIVFPPEARPTPLHQCLIEGDNLAVMAALLPEWQGRVDLIYADPPFMSGKRYATRIGRGEDSRKPEEWLLGEGYDDRWADPEAYLTMMYERLWVMRQLLSERGTLYLHADWHASHYLRLLLDELFGSERLLNEIAWVYHGPSPVRRAFNRKHDTILVYAKSAENTFNADAVRVPYDASTVQTFASSRLWQGAGPGARPSAGGLGVFSGRGAVARRAHWLSDAKARGARRTSRQSVFQRRRCGCRFLLWFGDAACRGRKIEATLAGLRRQLACDSHDDQAIARYAGLRAVRGMERRCSSTA
jgi:hypothetical protein